MPMKTPLDVRTSEIGPVNPGYGSVKGTALKKRAKKASERTELRKVSSSSDYCPDCGVKMSKMERYESGHHHYDD